MNFEGIPAPWPLDEMRERDVYFYEEATESYLPDNHVQVVGHGRMLMLGGYSYLGLNGDPRINQAAHDAILQYGTGAQGVRVLAGTLDLHKRLDQRIAHFKSTDIAITFTSGFSANVSIIAALVGRNDVVICDKLDHASIVDGCLVSQAEVVRFRHNDMAHLRECLHKHRERKNKLVVVDAVFSMDGDIVDLPAVSNLCREYRALLMVDEAHSLGVLGGTGHGVEEHFGMAMDTIDIKMGTFSKAIPSVGGYIATRAALGDAIRTRSRGYVYSAAVPPASAAAAIAALDIIEAEPERVQKLHENIAYFRDRLTALGLDFRNSSTAIFPIVCGDDWLALNLARYCQSHGVYVQAILHPVVPKGSARLRACVAANHRKEDLNFAAIVIRDGAETVGLMERRAPEIATSVPGLALEPAPLIEG